MVEKKMKKFVVISKANCARCRQFKDWLAQYDLNYEEWSVDTPEIAKKLLCDPKFIAQAIKRGDKYEIIAPVLYIVDTGEYFTRHLFGIDGIRDSFVKNVLDINDLEPKAHLKPFVTDKLYCTNDLVQKFLEKYILSIGICRLTGDMLYCFRVDPHIKMELISQFIAALSMFGEENLGKIQRVNIKGLEIEMSFVCKHDLIFVVLFHSGMVEDHLNEESEAGLDTFYAMFREPLEQKRSNRRIFDEFNKDMCILIQKFLVRIGVLECVDCNLEIPILKEKDDCGEKPNN